MLITRIEQQTIYTPEDGRHRDAWLVIINGKTYRASAARPNRTDVLLAERASKRDAVRRPKISQN
jgi:PhoPQ-activated pathogenicity-related protein